MDAKISEYFSSCTQTFSIYLKTVLFLFFFVFISTRNLYCASEQARKNVENETFFFVANYLREKQISVDNLILIEKINKLKSIAI